LADIVEERLATKQGIAILRRDMKDMETSLHRDMKDMECRMTIRLGAILAVSITIMGVLVKLL